MRRYEAADDFGKPETAFNICTFWRIDALARVGRVAEARAIFETMLQARNELGLLSEDTHPVTGEMWGNYPQTYSMVGIINAAVRLSAACLPTLWPAHRKPPLAALSLHPCIISLSCLRVIASDQALPVYPAG